MGEKSMIINFILHNQFIILLLIAIYAVIIATAKSRWWPVYFIIAALVVIGLSRLWRFDDDQEKTTHQTVHQAVKLSDSHHD
jgi:hypothetical protein